MRIFCTRRLICNLLELATSCGNVRETSVLSAKLRYNSQKDSEKVQLKTHLGLGCPTVLHLAWGCYRYVMICMINDIGMCIYIYVIYVSKNIYHQTGDQIHRFMAINCPPEKVKIRNPRKIMTDNHETIQ